MCSHIECDTFIVRWWWWHQQPNSHTHTQHIEQCHCRKKLNSRRLKEKKMNRTVHQQNEKEKWNCGTFGVRRGASSKFAMKIKRNRGKLRKLWFKHYTACVSIYDWKKKNQQNIFKVLTLGNISAMRNKRTKKKNSNNSNEKFMSMTKKAHSIVWLMMLIFCNNLSRQQKKCFANATPYCPYTVAAQTNPFLLLSLPLLLFICSDHCSFDKQRHCHCLTDINSTQMRFIKLLLSFWRRFHSLILPS